MKLIDVVSAMASNFNYWYHGVGVPSMPSQVTGLDLARQGTGSSDTVTFCPRAGCR
jgi:hypothetical protein